MGGFIFLATSPTFSQTDQQQQTAQLGDKSGKAVAPRKGAPRAASPRRAAHARPLRAGPHLAGPDPKRLLRAERVHAGPFRAESLPAKLLHARSLQELTAHARPPQVRLPHAEAARRGFEVCRAVVPAGSQSGVAILPGGAVDTAHVMGDGGGPSERSAP